MIAHPCELLIQLYGMCRCVFIEITLDKSNTRCASTHRLIRQLLRMAPAIQFLADDRETPAGLQQKAAKTWDVIEQLAEAEGVLCIIASVIVCVQSEVAVNGAYFVVAIALLEQHLNWKKSRNQAYCTKMPYTEIELIDWTAPGSGTHPKRKSVQKASLSGFGQTCLDRGMEELEHRVRQEYTKPTGRQFAAMMLDWRTLKCLFNMLPTLADHISQCLEDLYVEFYLNKIRTESNLKKPQPTAPASGAQAGAQLQALFGGKFVVPTESSDVDNEDVQLDKHRSDARAEYETAFSHWFVAAFNFNFKQDELFKKTLEYLDEKTDPTLVEDLWQLNILPLLDRLSQNKKFGLLPLMALSQLGSHLAASFSERVNSAAKDKIGDHRRRLTDAEAEMEIILRINRPFMLHMKKCYPNIVKEYQDKLIANCPDFGQDDADVVTITPSEERSSASTAVPSAKSKQCDISSMFVAPFVSPSEEEARPESPPRSPPNCDLAQSDADMLISEAGASQ
jgi:hypothetical protein